MSRLTKLIGFICIVVSSARALAQVPQAPPTDRFSVQMFMGQTQNCWIAVYPPTNNTDGSPLAAGSPVQIKVYRSYDGGKTYGEQGVKIVGGASTNGTGKVGQGEMNAQEKEWIDLKLETPVDEQEPYAIWLSVSAVVNGKEGEQTNRFLNFRYREKGGGRPVLIRYETPDVSGEGVADEVARPLPQELAGKWDKGGEFVIRSYSMTPGMKSAMDKGQVEGCSAEMLKMFDSMRNKPMGMEMDVKTIDLVEAPGLNGVPVDPATLRKIIFPGTMATKVIDPSKPGEAKYGQPINFAYNYRDSFFKVTEKKDNARTLMGGHFFKTASEYLLVGTWRVIYTDDKMPGEWFELRGTWKVTRNKPV